MLGVLWAQEDSEGSCGCCVGCLKVLVGARVFLWGSVNDGGSGRCWGWSQGVYGLRKVLVGCLCVMTGSGRCWGGLKVFMGSDGCWERS